MSWIMSIAAGLAIGYFVWQLVVNNKEGGAKTTGRLHKSTKDKKIAGVCGGISATTITLSYIHYFCKQFSFSSSSAAQASSRRLA